MKAAAVIFIAVMLPACALADYDPPPHPLFDADAVHVIELTFSQPDWYDQLTANYEDEIYLAAAFDWETTHFDSIGVRFKGNSSYHGYPGDKKPFKLDINEFVGGQDIDGIDKLNLNNCFKDPSFAREKCYWELVADAGLPYIRVNYAALYINGDYWGLYTLTETVNSEFLEMRFGDSEDGTLFKGDPHGTLEWQGPDEADYYDDYELTNNEAANDWTGLIRLIDIINHTPATSLPDSLSDILDVNSAMGMLAVNNLTVNLDSYGGSGHNHYLYEREADDRFVAICWDANEAWGGFSMGMPINVLKNLHPMWLPSPPESRPLAHDLWAPELPYADIYRGHIQSLMAGAGQPDALLARMTALRDLVRNDVYADTKKMYTDTDFDNAMTVDIGGIPGLDPFIRDRHNFLESVLGSYTPIENLVLNELMAVNDTTIADGFGEYDDWLEIANTGDDPIALGGLYLTDDMAYPELFALPDTTLATGAYLLVWCDDDTEQGDIHAGFKLSSGGETVYLLDGSIVFDQVSFDPIGADQSFGRWPDGDGAWQMLSAATPGTENENPEDPEEIVLYINEFMAKNDSNIQDETGAYEDWAEIWNPGPDAVEMGGLYLTDDLASTTKWAFPDTILPAGGFLLVWCDDDTGDGPLHTNFKLGASGEEIGLFGRLAAGNEEIDSYVFGAQTADISEGRETDGAETWVFFTEPTPEATNDDQTGLPGDTPPGGFALHRCAPNPFNLATRIAFDLPGGAGRVRLCVYDLAGRLVATLVDGELPAGTREVTWDGLDNSGRAVTSGVYFSRLDMDGRSRIGKLVVLR